MMKILHIHSAMKGGGIGAMICSLSNEMVKKEEVTVCSIFEPKASDVFWSKLNPHVNKLTLGKAKQGFSIVEIFRIIGLLWRGNYDVVHIHGFFYYYALAVLLLHGKIEFFYTIHSDARMENAKWDKMIFCLKKFCFRRDWIHPITISSVSQESFYSLYGCDSRLIYNGISLPIIEDEDALISYRKTEQISIFLHAGRIDAAKNQLVLCQVFKKLIDEGLDVLLLIAGSKQNEDIFTAIEPFFCDRIIYLGERNDIPQLMAHCDAMCLPSIWEGMPVTLLESLSVGCIPICSPVGGIPNVITNGLNGLLSISSSEKDYYDAVMNYLSLTDKQRIEMKQNCLSSSIPFDIKNTAESYLLYYHQYL